MKTNKQQTTRQLSLSQVQITIYVFALAIMTSFATMAKVPPGTVMISENFFFDQTEISNIAYKEYLSWIKKHHESNSPEYKAALPDTTVWRRPKASNEPFVEFYLNHPAYNAYPVVGVSYEQAVAFCNWRSDRVNEKIYRNEHKIKSGEAFDLENIPKVYKYRLPTKVEWEKVASVGYSKKVQKRLKRKKCANIPHKNFAHDTIITMKSSENKLTNNGYITCNVRNHFPNALDIYNIMGNVAELTATKGVAKGGSWKHKAKDVTIEKDFPYEKPADWLGFRCVCEKVN